MRLIEINELSKKYENDFILKNINIKVEKGSILGMIGPTGSGKTTILRMINLLENPTDGKIIFDGIDTTRETEVNKLKIRRRMAMVFQKPEMFRGSVHENVAFGLKVRGIKKDIIDERVKETLDMLGLLDYEKRNAYTLSGGETQRVSFARAIITEPEVLLLDEPTANLDPRTASMIEDLILSMNHEKGTTIILATHNMYQSQRLVDMILVLMNGEINQIGSPKEIFSSPKNEVVANFVRWEAGMNPQKPRD